MRADASRSIGAGHVMRSSAIAEELITRGEDVVFIGQISNLPWVEERIASLGFSRIYNQSSDYSPNSETDVLILDSYEIDIHATFILLENWLHVIVIADALTPNYRCTLRIHPGVDSDWVGDSLTPILAGPKYIPFRSSLSKNLHVVNQVPHKLRIAVVAGGSDPYGLVQEITRILAKIPEQFEVYLFSNSNFASALDSRFLLFEVGKKLDVLTKDVDLVLTTASTSSLEFLARGLCVGIACAVENQEQNYISLSKLGVAAKLGVRNTDNCWELDESMISSLVTSSKLRSELVARAEGLFDFKGSSRIVDAITSL
jgi:spore coat polysaccharide biosynthesis predicted glycosyltransferase SpsG